MSNYQYIARLFCQALDGSLFPCLHPAGSGSRTIRPAHKFTFLLLTIIPARVQDIPQPYIAVLQYSYIFLPPVETNEYLLHLLHWNELVYPPLGFHLGIIVS